MQNKEIEADTEALKQRRRRVALHRLSKNSKQIDERLKDKLMGVKRSNGMVRGSVEIAART